MPKSPEELIQDLQLAMTSKDALAEKRAAMALMAQLLRDINRIANASVIIAHYLSNKDK